ncbi:leucine-rich repeat and transmembrane domain-containing protein 2 isoform X2 [Denticeps clupeoides]|uniref:leucine-rich repeat and transmembrane domain-containing protein 2 isoform X2 n=1 Tax=Denticeps clupeoides TaxID=299321 RepID=UPI0010A46B7C|nr:leucine-rich repeat and transmembrane domain-containing protein 2-like isoform X2 [Denticeps clupeoides]
MTKLREVFVALVWLLGVVVPAGSCPSACICAGTDVGCSDQALDSLVAIQLPMETHSLQLSRNRLTSLGPKSFSSLSLLESLDLSNNQLSTVDSRSFFNLSQLKYLNLSSNSFVELPPALFRGLGMLTELSISNSSLEILNGDIFLGLTKLRHLDLSQNRLASLPQGLLEDLQGLRWLSLAMNRLRVLQRSSFELLKDLQGLKLAENPWECNCSMLEFKHWMEWMLYRGGHVDALDCTLPTSVQGRDIRTVPAEMFGHCKSLGSSRKEDRGGSQLCSKSLDGLEGEDCLKQRYRPNSMRRAAGTVVVAGVVCGTVCIMMVVASTYGCIYALMAAKYHQEQRDKEEHVPHRDIKDKYQEQEENNELLPEPVEEPKIIVSEGFVFSREVCV